MSEVEYLCDSYIDDKDISTTMVLSSDLNRAPVSCKAILKQPLVTAATWKVFHNIATIEDCFKGQDIQLPAASRQQLDNQSESNTKHNRGTLRHSKYYVRKQLREYLLHKARQENLAPSPLVTVHQDKIIFESLSRDHSTYCRIDLGEVAMDLVETPRSGTTQFAYSRMLDKGFNKVRDYKQTFLVIDPGRDDIDSDTEQHEAEPDLIDPLYGLWLRKILLFNSATVNCTKHFTLDVMDIYNLVMLMKRYARATHSSGLTFRLAPGQPVEIVLDPWGETLACPNSCYHGEAETELRLWGRDRFKFFEPLFPYLDSLDVYFDAPGSPVFFLTQVDGIRCLLGMTNTTLGDWSRIDAQDYLATTVDVKGVTRIRILKELQEVAVASAGQLSQVLKLSESLVRNALYSYLQSGRVLYDLYDDTFRIREITPSPVPLERVHYPNQSEARARVLLEQGNAVIDSIESLPQYDQVGGTVTDNAIQYQPDLIFDREGQLLDANCFCKHYSKYKLTNGPCEHITAVQILFSQNNEVEPIEVEELP